MKNILASFLRKAKSSDDLLEGFNAPLGTFSARAPACHALGLIQDNEFDEISKIRKVRNEFGHQWQGVNFRLGAHSRPRGRVALGWTCGTQSRGAAPITIHDCGTDPLAPFVKYAADILADTSFGLSGAKIASECAAYAVEWGVDIPHATHPFGADVVTGSRHLAEGHEQRYKNAFLG